jgi:prepilin peptidase CpaA
LDILKGTHVMLLLLISTLYLIVLACDIAFRKIPDICPALITASGFAMLMLGDDWVQVFTTVGLAVGTFLVLALLCMAGKLGGGDVKLMAASVLLVGAGSFLDFLLLTALAGGLLSLIYITAFLMLKHLPAPSVAVSTSPSKAQNILRLNLLWRIERRRILRRSSIPYGVAISVGSFLALTISPV